MRKILIFILGVYQIFGGLFGLFNFLVYLGSAEKIGEILLTAILGLPFCILSILAGGVLILKSNWKLSIICQLLQIIQFKIDGLAFYFVSGIYLGVGYKFWDGFFFNFSILESFVLIKINQVGGKSIIGLSLVSLCLFLLMNYLSDKQKMRKKIR